MTNIIEKFLSAHNIKYALHQHKPVFTSEDLKGVKSIPGTHAKNLFLKKRKSEIYILVIVSAEKRLNMKMLGRKIGVNNLTFANEVELKKILGVSTGSVSPLGLLNDKNNIVKLFIDTDVWNAEITSFHPNINTESFEFKKDDFHKLIKALTTKFTVIDV